MKRLYGILLLLWLSSLSYAQVYTEAEYFFDSDPGIGNGIAISLPASSTDSLDLNLSIPTAGLSEGAHQLYVRFRDTADQWSLVYGQTFNIYDNTGTNSVQISGGEYFFDTDPGIGNGIALSGINPADSLNLFRNMEVSNLSPGTHTVYFRFYDSNGNWGQVQGHTFSIIDSGNGSSVKIIAGEYFFDSDPGVGNGTAFTNISSSDSLDLSRAIDISGLSIGSHQLFCRFLDSQGNWGQLKGYIFSIVDSSNGISRQITGGEYFIDSDPGMGNAKPIPNFTSMDSLDMTMLISTDTLSTGTHHLYFRFYDNMGIWGQIASDSFEIVNCNMPVANFCVSDVCFGDSVYLIDSSTQVNSNTSYQWDLFNNQNHIDTTKGSIAFLPQLAGSYTAKLVLNNGSVCVDSVFKTYNVFSLPDVNIGADTTICTGDSILLNAGTFSGYIWSNGTTDSITKVSGPATCWVIVTDSNQCKKSDSLILGAFPLTNISISGLDTSYCLNDAPSFVSGMPAGGIFSGTGMQDSLFSPLLAGTGLHSIVYQYTDTNTCQNSDTNQTRVYGLPAVHISSLLDSTYCATGDSIKITASPGGGVFSGSPLSSGNYLILSPNNSGSKTIIYTYTDANNCSNYDTVSTMVYPNPFVYFTGLAATYCSNDEESVLVPNHLGGIFSGPGVNGNIFNPANAPAGSINILYRYKDEHSCKDTAVYSTTIYQAPVINSFTAAPNSFSTPPFNSHFSPNVNNPADYNWNWYFGDGNTSSDSTSSHLYSSNGTYTISLAAQDIATGCSDTAVKTNYIHCSGATPCNLGAHIWNDTLNTASICPGDSFLLSSGSYNAAYSYLWVRNGIMQPNSNTNQFYAKSKGYYQVVISNGSCMDISSIFYLDYYPSIKPVIAQQGYIEACSNDSVRLYSILPQPNYQWSTGDTTSEIYIKQSGYYTLSVINSYGCSVRSQPQIVNASALPVPELCRVSVDSLSGYNKLQWNNILPATTDSFKIYRETYVTDQFDLIATLAASDTLFTDQSSTPQSRFYRYRMSAVDTCGVETPLSNFHRTIKLTVIAGLNNNWNLSWNHYAGRATITYQIYRGKDSTNMQLLSQLPSNIHTFTDISAPTGDFYYRIRAIFRDSCHLTSKSSGLSFTLSNLANTINATGIGIKPLSKAEEKAGMRVYPNPNKGSFFLEFVNIHEGMSDVEMFDATGKRVYFHELQILNGVKPRLDVQNLARGMYIIRLMRQGKMLAQQIIVIQ